MNILEEFWYGNIEPVEYDISSSKEYKELLQLISRNEEKLFATMTEAQPMDILPIRIPFTWGMPLPVHIGSQATILASIHAIATKAATYKRGKSHLPSPAASLIFSYTICLKSSEAPKR